MLNRRDFIAGLGDLASLGGVGSALAQSPFNRRRPSLSGLSLAAYSLRSEMRWAWGKERDKPLEMMGFLEYCAELGLDAAELTSYFFAEPLQKASINALKRRAHLLGLDISGGAMGNSFAYEPGSAEAVQQMAYFRMWIDRFADLGAPVARVFAERGRPLGASDEAVIRNVVANLQLALPYAESRGVMLGLENHDLTRNIDYLLRILREVDSPWLGVTWDTANLLDVPDPYAELERIAPYAVTAQVKVKTKVNGEEVPADYGRLMNILLAANYRGYVVFEYEEEENPIDAIPQHIVSLRKALVRAQLGVDSEA